MKYPHTGLFHFCLQLGNALLKNIDDEKEGIQFFLPQSVKSFFPVNINSKHIKFWHKVLTPSTNNISVWHATHQDTNYFPFNKKVPVVLTIHDLNYFNDLTKSSAKKDGFIKSLKKKVEAASHLTFISNFSLQDFEQYIPLNNKPYSIIYNGCNINEVEVLQTPNYLPTKPFLFTIGTIAEKKNFHVLPALLKKNDYTLVVAGITQNQEYKKKILQEAKKHSVEDRVVFVNAVSENDKQWYYKNCEAFVFPSLAEGFGLPVVEAMYFGKPVFLSTATSLPEIGGNAAFYFSSFDAEQMLETFLAGMQQYQQNNMKDIIIDRAGKFNWSNAAEKYLKIYRSFY